MNLLGKFLYLMVIGFALSLWSCAQGISQESEDIQINSKAFKDYWYSGKAELTRYELKQARYGQIHEGDAVLIFVTEDFRTDKQVKYEGGNKSNVESVLKLNFTRKFFTGLYPYSMMSSIFTPVNPDKKTYKVATSSQEWCGHTYAQLNLRKNQYKGRIHSYFQDEGDQEFTLDAAMLEDEIWNKIRLNPASLPTGEIQLIPGSMFLRLRHRKYAVEKASASVASVENPSLSPKPLTRYSVEYADFPRVLEITYETEFPHAIVAWEEQTTSGFGQENLLTTKAVRTHTMNSAYWGQHNITDGQLRTQLGLDPSHY